MAKEFLVKRSVAVGSCVIGVIEVLVATFAAICAFIMLGAFCVNLECINSTDGIGFWIAFPLLVPGILGIIVLATRHQKAALFYLLTNIAVLALGAAHTFVTWRDYDDHWKGQLDMFNDGKCSANGYTGCDCDGTAYPYQCDLIEFGHDLNFIMFGLSCAAMLFSAIGCILGLLGACISKPAEPSESWLAANQ